MDKILGRYVLISHANFSKEFTIHTDSRKIKLEGVIIQDEKSINFYSIKLTTEKLIVQIQK